MWGASLARERAALSRAQRYLDKLVDTAKQASSSARLPTIMSMARSANVSKTTRIKAVRVLRDQGRLTVKTGSGVVLADSAQHEKAYAEPVHFKEGTPVYLRVADMLRKDIVSGRYPAGTMLPKTAQLTEKYGVCYRTLIKALHMLVDTGVIERVRKSYRIPEPCSPSGLNHIILVVAGLALDTRVLLEMRGKANLRYFEAECAAWLYGLDNGNASC